MTNDLSGVSGAQSALAAAMREILSTMHPTTRGIFLRHWLGGWSYARIAEESGIALAEVEQHVALAIHALDIGLKNHGL